MDILLVYLAIHTMAYVHIAMKKWFIILFAVNLRGANSKPDKYAHVAPTRGLTSGPTPLPTSVPTPMSTTMPTQAGHLVRHRCRRACQLADIWTDTYTNERAYSQQVPRLCKLHSNPWTYGWFDAFQHLVHFLPTSGPTPLPISVATPMPTAVPTHLTSGPTLLPTSVPRAMPTVVPTPGPTPGPAPLPCSDADRCGRTHSSVRCQQGTEQLRLQWCCRMWASASEHSWAVMLGQMSVLQSAEWCSKTMSIQERGARQSGVSNASSLVQGTYELWFRRQCTFHGILPKHHRLARHQLDHTFIVHIVADNSPILCPTGSTNISTHMCHIISL